MLACASVTGHSGGPLGILRGGNMQLSNYVVRGLCFAVLGSAVAPAQSIYGTLTGIVSDQSQSVIANATVRLRDQQSGSQRETKTNTDGYYTFVSVPPGGYQLTVTVAGFETYSET